MWRIIICAVILVICTGQPLEETSPTPEKDKDPITTVVIQESPTPPPAPSTAAPTELPQQVVEITKPVPVTELPAATPVVELEEDNDAGSKRRVVTYDQRQEGQYNIRADLENFMIVLIPPSPMDGVNLLDLLSKSSKRTKSAHKKYHHDVAGSKYRQSLKSGANSHNFNFLGRHQQPQQLGPHIIVEQQPAERISEFIEGRTPYRVDISSTGSDMEQLQQQYQLQQQHGPQVDVLPPPYPLSYHHLIKPFHLEAEPTIIQTLPPQSAAGSGKFMDANGNFFRMARAIQGGSLYGLLSLDSNRVQPRHRNVFDEQLLGTSEDEEEVGEARSVDLPLTSDSLEEAIHNYVYPPLNPLRFSPGLLDPQSRAMNPNYPKYNEEENAKATEIELKLLGATEECGPDRKRDSYGICRFAGGY